MTTQLRELQSISRERAVRPEWMGAAVRQLTEDLGRQLSEDALARLERSLEQIAALWREEDGAEREFLEFVRANFARDKQARDAIFQRLEAVLEQIDGHLHEIRRVLREPVDLDAGPLLPIDETLAGYEVSAHVSDDLFQNKVAFVALLNFPLYTLEEKLRFGEEW